jgi:hypothetical protein
MIEDAAQTQQRSFVFDLLVDDESVPSTPLQKN